MTWRGRSRGGQKFQNLNYIISGHPLIDNIVISKKDQAVNKRCELFWTLVNSLLITFDSPTPTSLSLFQNCKKLNKSGYIKLFLYYNKEKERLIQIYRQEVLKID